MILEKEVATKVHSRKIEYYEKLGYIVPKYRDKNGILRVKRGTAINVKLMDLPEHSTVKITKVCDECGDTCRITYGQYLKSDSYKNKKDLCKKCADRNRILEYHSKQLDVNSIAKMNPSMMKLLWNKKDGYNYSYQSNKKVDFKCPTCNMKVQEKRIQDVFKYGLSCHHCSDGYSYPEKIMFELLNQIGYEFISQKTFSWSKGKRYDFYIPSMNLIIEIHGAQHYEDTGFETKGGRSLEEEVKNDEYKKDLALINGINEYIAINAKVSELEYIKNSILESKLKELFYLHDIDWIRCHEFACNSMIKLVCELWNNENNIISISKKLKIHRVTVRRYLKSGNKIGWCKYDSEENLKNRGSGKKTTRKAVQLTIENEFIKEWDSLTEVKDFFNLKSVSSVTRACKDSTKNLKGFKWMYLDDYKNKTGVIREGSKIN